MKLVSIMAMLIITALLIVIAVQGNTVEQQRQLIREMYSNPYCMGAK